jgi:hypothetical protein
VNARRLALERVDRSTYQTAGFAVLAAAVAIGLAACSGSISPRAAGPDGSSATPAATSTSAATPSGSKATQLLDQWAACMRSHGDPDQADPTIDANQVIHVIQPAGYYGTMYGPSAQNESGAGVICQAYLTAASTAVRGGQPLPTGGSAPGFGATLPGEIDLFGPDGRLEFVVF